MSYARRVCLTRYPNGAAEVAAKLNILRVGDTLIFYTRVDKQAFDRHVRELLN